MTVIHLRHAMPGLLVLAPDGAPLVTDVAPSLDVLVLEVVGGYLSWGLLGGQLLPAAVLDDAAAAQDWVWAVYGEEVALAVADNHPQALTAAPARPESVTALRRLAYAHWVSRWWPASTVDGIPPLDPRLLLEEIELLEAECEMVLGAAVRHDDTESSADDFGLHVAVAGRGPIGDAEASNESRGRAEDYALAAGGADPSDGLIIARGSGGWDWRRCPPGILDAGERAVSWQVARAAGISTVRVSVVAAPDCRRVVPEHLRPYVRVRPAEPGHAGRDHAGSSPVEFTTPLHLRGDAWTGTVQLPGPTEAIPEITVFVPGVGSADQPPDESAVRNQIRRFARTRLTDQGGDPRLNAETAAAETDEDF